MSATKLTPAELVASRFGGQREFQKLLKLSGGQVSNWIARGGHIPNRNKMHERILAKAKQKSVPLTAEELVLGGIA